MNFLYKQRIDAKEELRKRAQYVRDGGALNVFKPDDVHELQTYALDIKDIQLYDYLNKYWAQA